MQFKLICVGKAKGAYLELRVNMKSASVATLGEAARYRRPIPRKPK